MISQTQGIKVLENLLLYKINVAIDNSCEIKLLGGGQQDDLSGAYCKACWPEFNPWDIHGGRGEPSLSNCPLASIHTP